MRAKESVPPFSVPLRMSRRSLTQKKPRVDFLSIRPTSFPPSDLLSASVSCSPSSLRLPFLNVHSAAQRASQTHTLRTHTHTHSRTGDSRGVNIGCLTSSCFWSVYTTRRCSSPLPPTPPPLFVCFQARDGRTACDLWLFIFLRGF